MLRSGGSKTTTIYALYDDNERLLVACGMQSMSGTRDDILPTPTN